MYLFDEVQRLYKDCRDRSSQVFWGWVKSCVGQMAARISTLIVMAAAYGDKPSGASGTSDTDSPSNTPIRLIATQEVSLAPATATTASLQLTNNEWEELWSAFLGETALRLGMAVKSFLWSICGGQVSCTTVHHNSVCMPACIWAKVLCQLLSALAGCGPAKRQSCVLHACISSLCASGWSPDDLPRLPGKGAQGGSCSGRGRRRPCHVSVS